jgi:hypothetical protein
MRSQSIDDQALETMVHSESSERRKSSFASTMVRIWNLIVESLTTVNELKIDSLKSRSGSCYWAIHDPILGRRVFFDSEAEVREWLDRRYYE